MKITMGFAWPMYCLLLLLSSVVIQVLSAETLEQDNFPSPLHFQGGFRPSAAFQPATSQDASLRASATSSATSGRRPHVFLPDEESETRQQKQDDTKHRPLKTFDGFPADFKEGLRPFKFGDSNSNAHTDSSETFSNFPQNSKESQRPHNDPRDTLHHQPLRNINGQLNSFESTSSTSPQKPSGRPLHQDDFQQQQRFVNNFQNSGRFPAQFPQGFPPQRGSDNSNQPQTFIPIAHFQPPGPFQFGAFQPFVPESQGTHFGPPRPFRQITQPLFFAPPGLRFEGNRGQFQGGRHFPRRPQQQPPQRPQSHFQLQQQQQEDQPEHEQQQPFHEDNTNKHHTSATDNILGSGNFGIIRGGIFADDDNPRPSFQPFQHDYRPQNNDEQEEDFFNGFHDFQPFPGPLNNALTSLTARGVESTSTSAKTVKLKKETTARPRKV